MDLEETIVGCATASGDGCRAILRLSGPESWVILARLLDEDLQPANPTANARSRRWNARLRIPGWRRSVDAQVLIWAGGRSYTGQPTVELHVPACAPLVDEFVAECRRRGARLARPGEFTLRSFLSGRLDLAQAEGVLGLIESRSIEELNAAVDQRSGGLSRPIAATRGALLDLLADLEAGLDFVEEDIRFLTEEELARRLVQARDETAALLRSMEARARSDDLPRVVLVGPPNAGKSSLFNALVGRQRALTSPRAGTTRDYVSAEVEWYGVPLELVDTAGTESPADEIESQAARLRERTVRQADIVLACSAVDAPAEHDRAIAPSTLLVRTKSDLTPGRSDPSAAIACSAKSGEGLEELKRLLVREVRGARKSRAISAAPRRWRAGLEEAVAALEEAMALSAGREGAELVAPPLRRAIDALGEIVGAVYTEDLLDRIFSRFCIGK